MNARGKITLLTFFFALCGTGAVVTAYLQARADANVKPSELYAVIDRQLSCLRGGDFPHAYAAASAAIQQRYSVQQFADMVQMDYPGLTHVNRAQYGATQTNGRRATMQVFLIGENGEVMPCVYNLVRESGGWRIDGARLMPPWPKDMKMDGTTL